MDIPRILLAGSASHVGKTIISLGLICALRKRGYRVQPFKVGPDYIDTGYHTKVASVCSRNIDSFLMDEETILNIFERNFFSSNADIAVIEGVRGLYEGASVATEEGSTAHIAKMLQSPIILIIDVASLNKSAAALVLGFMHFDADCEIKGIIANNIAGEEHKKKVKEAIERFTDCEVLGTLPKDEELRLKERHLGLITAVESFVEEKIEKIRDKIEENVNVERIIEIAKSAKTLQSLLPAEKGKIKKNKINEEVNIGVAYDNAFNFYYEDSLDLLRSEGCNIHFFSPINNEKLPEGCDGLFFGGGYPEIFALELSKNKKMRKCIKKLAEDEMPIYAECGGLIYLANKLSFEKRNFNMVGFLPCSAKMGRRHVSLTINEIIRDTIIGKKGIIKGHEFHYTEIYDIARDAKFAYRMLRGTGMDGSYDGIVEKKALAAFTHLHFASDIRIVENIVKNLKEYRKK